MDKAQASKLRVQFEKLRNTHNYSDGFKRARTVAELEDHEKNRIDQI